MKDLFHLPHLPDPPYLPHLSLSHPPMRFINRRESIFSPGVGDVFGDEKLLGWALCDLDIHMLQTDGLT